MRKSTIPSHYALTMEQTGKVHWSISYAQAILTLIKNDSINNEGDGPDEFISSAEVIKTAISAAQYFLKEAEESSKQGKYLTLGVNND